MNLISIGGWCGTKIALRDSGLFNEPSLPFDDVRSSIDGVIDCIANDFANFFPKEIRVDSRFGSWRAFVGQYIGFFHPNHDLRDRAVVESFNRKIKRFGEKVRNGRCVFLRTIVRHEYYDEIHQYKRLQEALDAKYPGISYIVCFIIPNQPTTRYYKHLDDRTFLFTLNDNSGINNNLKNEYKPIFDFLMQNDLFTTIPPPQDDIVLINTPSRLWYVDGHPMVNHVESEQSHFQ